MSENSERELREELRDTHRVWRWEFGAVGDRGGRAAERRRSARAAPPSFDPSIPRAYAAIVKPKVYLETTEISLLQSLRGVPALHGVGGEGGREPARPRLKENLF